MTSPNVIRHRRCHCSGQSSSRRDLLSAETTSSSTSLSKYGCGQQTDAEDCRLLAAHYHRASSTLPLPRRAQLGVIVDGPHLRHSLPSRQQRQCDELYCHHHHHHHHQQQQQQQRQRYDQDSTFSRASTLQRGNNGTTNTSTSSTIGRGYFTDGESSTEQSKHHQRQPRGRRRLAQQPAASSPRHSEARSISTSNCREFRGSPPSPTGLRRSVAGGRSRPYGRTFPFPPRSPTRSRDRTFAVSSSGAERAGGSYSTWPGGCSSRRSAAAATTDFDAQPPRRLAWRLQTPHGTLSLRSTRWSEVSPADRTLLSGTERSSLSSANDWRRRSTDGRWMTVPRQQSRWTTSDGTRAQTLPASFRPGRRRRSRPSHYESLSLEPIGRGIETLECEQCYLAATAHLSAAAAAESPTTTLPS